MMKEKVEPKTLPGFMELMPQDQILFDKMKNTIESVYSSYGFYPLDTPIIELSSVLLAKAGGETEKQIYRFNKGDNDLSLRFDLTVPLAKYVANRSNELIFPFKRYQIGKVYRGERPQKGRFREFYQCDIDVIGNETLSILYDAEIPSIIYDLFKKLNIGDFTIRINNRKILTGFFNSLELNSKVTDILRIIDKIEKIGEDEVKSELSLLDIDSDKVSKIIDFIRISGDAFTKIERLKNLGITDEVYNEGVNELETVINNIKARGLDSNFYDVDLTIARGLDYYTGTVYETILKDYPSIGSVCSGGRYENLATYYTDKKLPGVGISIGLTRLFYQLKEAGVIKTTDSSVADITILPMTENYEYVYKFSNLLKRFGVRVDTAFLGKFKQLMRYADKQKTPYVLIIGDDEISKGVAVLKDMFTGLQTEVTLENIIEIYNRLLK
ncbi:MAG TPA: histidine--tRNA ligase [Firmicutes bacterium]|nr:histidine--tRNA ligase [Bacillota bacterium]